MINVYINHKSIITEGHATEGKDGPKICAMVSACTQGMINAMANILGQPNTLTSSGYYKMNESRAILEIGMTNNCTEVRANVVMMQLKVLEYQLYSIIEPYKRYFKIYKEKQRKPN